MHLRELSQFLFRAASIATQKLLSRVASTSGAARPEVRSGLGRNC